MIMGVLLFVGFLITTSVGFMISRHFIRAGILQNELPLSSNNIYSEIQRDLFEPILISSLMANDTFVKAWIMKGEREPGEIIHFLSQIQEKYGTITAFLVSEETRKYYNATEILKEVHADDVADAWFFRVRTMKPNYEINVDPDLSNQNAMTIFINYRVLGDEGRFLAATGVGLSVSAVKNLMQEYRKRYHRDVYFYDRNGNLVLHSLGEGSDAEGALSDHTMEKTMREVIERIDQGETDITASATSQSGLMTSYRFIPELNWILVVEQATDGTRSMLFQTIGLNVLVALVTAGMLVGIMQKADRRYRDHLETKNHDLEIGRAKLLQANAARERLFAIIGHDLRGPMGNVKSSLELLESGDLDRNTFREWSVELRIQVDHLLVTLDNLMQWGSLQSKSLTPRFEVVPMRMVAQDGLGLLQLIAKEKGIQMENLIPDEAVVWADKHQIQSVLRNLLSNAIKFTPQGGRVSFRAEPVAGGWKTFVQDNGVGMDSDRAEYFTHSSNHNESTPGTDNERGFGLGLQICRDFIAANHGTLHVESVPNQGTTISFVLASPPSA